MENGWKWTIYDHSLMIYILKSMCIIFFNSYVKLATGMSMFRSKAFSRHRCSDRCSLDSKTSASCRWELRALGQILGDCLKWSLPRWNEVLSSKFWVIGILKFCGKFWKYHKTRWQNKLDVYFSHRRLESFLIHQGCAWLSKSLRCTLWYPMVWLISMRRAHGFAHAAEPCG